MFQQLFSLTFCEWCSAVGSTPKMGKTKDAIDESKVTVADACCCFYEGFNLSDTPIGCACNEVCICLQCECCCKNNMDPDMYPACYCCGIACESPSTCIKSEQNCCCMFAACAFPPDEEVPCMIATCCIMCYPTMGCCNTIGTVRGDPPENS